MEPDISKRLGTLSVEQITSHPFFKGVDWDKVGSYDPPFCPLKEKPDKWKNKAGMDLQTFVEDEFSKELAKAKVSNKKGLSGLQVGTQFEFLRHDLLHKQNKAQAKLIQ